MVNIKINILRCTVSKISIFTPYRAIEAKRYSSTVSLTSALDGVCDKRHAPAALSPGKRPDTGGWVGLEPVWTVAENRSHTGVRTQFFQPVGSRCIDCGVPAAIVWCKNCIFKYEWNEIWTQYSTPTWPQCVTTLSYSVAPFIRSYINWCTHEFCLGGGSKNSVEER